MTLSFSILLLVTLTHDVFIFYLCLYEGCIIFCTKHRDCKKTPTYFNEVVRALGLTVFIFRDTWPDLTWGHFGLITCLTAALPPTVSSSPGTGKSSGPTSFCWLLWVTTSAPTCSPPLTGLRRRALCFLTAPWTRLRSVLTQYFRGKNIMSFSLCSESSVIQEMKTIYSQENQL